MDCFTDRYVSGRLGISRLKKEEPEEETFFEVTKTVVFVCPKCNGKNFVKGGKHAGKCMRCDVGLV